MNDTTSQPTSAGEAAYIGSSHLGMLPQMPYSATSDKTKEAYEVSAQAAIQWHQSQRRDVPSVDDMLLMAMQAIGKRGHYSDVIEAVRSAILAALPTQAEVEKWRMNFTLLVGDSDPDKAADKVSKVWQVTAGERDKFKARAEKAEYDKEQAINREAEMMATAQGLQQQLAASEQASLAKVEEMRLQLRISEQARKEAEEKSRHPRINTRCPSCGSTTLALNDDGKLFCTLIGCKNPLAIAELAASREAGKGWIRSEDRLPTKRDAGINNCVVGIGSNGLGDKYVRFFDWQSVNKHPQYCHGWLPIPPLPSAPEPEKKPPMEFVGPSVDFRKWWDSKDWTFGGDATPLAIAGMAWEAAHNHYVFKQPLPTPPPDPLEEVKPQTEKWFLTNPPTLEEKWAKERAAYAKGKVIQWRYRSPSESEGVDWSDCPNPKWINSPGDEYRIAPTPEPAWTLPEPAPERVALSAEDVPPGSAIKNGRYRNGEWAIVIEVELKGVSINNRTEEIISWRELMEHFEILRPGSTTWEPCSKPAAQAKEGAV